MNSIDQKILQIQRSTRTKIPFLCPLHNKLRASYTWYYRWHLWQGAKYLHEFILVLFVLLIGANMISPLLNQRAQSASATFLNSNTTTATFNTSQKKSFYDDKEEVHWGFHAYDATTIVYGYSADASSWTHGGQLTSVSDVFSLHYKNISNQGYVFIAYECDTYDICINRGTLGATSITWSGSEKVFDGSSVSDAYTSPTVSTDASHYVWVGAIRNYGTTLMDRYQIKTRRTTSVNNITGWNSILSVGRKVSALKEITLMPQSGSNMYLLSNSDTPNVVGYTYDGTSWSDANDGGDYSWFSFGGGGANGLVYAIAVLGSDVYFGGEFTNVGGIAGTRYIARWDGSAWHSTGAIFNNTVFTLNEFDGELYAGGWFTEIDGQVFNGIARFDGSAWHALGSGVAGIVWSVAKINNDLYVGGTFTSAGGVADTARIARWDGSTWHALGTGANQTVYAITVLGSDIYVGGAFTNIGGSGINYIARWNGSSWNALGSGVNSSVNDIVVSGSDLYVGGGFTTAGGGSANFIARWNGTSWSSLGTGLAGDVAKSITISGGNIYVGGNFSSAGGQPNTAYFAQWNGSAWSAVGGGGFASYVEVVAVVGSGVYAGGWFGAVGSTPETLRVAYWDGVSWQSLGKGIGASVSAMAIDGSDVYIGGSFTTIHGETINRIARFDGSQWHALGTGADQFVKTIAISGSNVYVGGWFAQMGGVANTAYIARWDGASWHAMGTGMNSWVNAIIISGSDIYAGGNFTSAGGVANTAYIARWNGSSWNAMGTGMSSRVEAITVSGSDIYAGGAFTSAGGVANTAYIARWNGSSWNAMGTGMSSWVYALAVSGSDVFAGGLFTSAGGVANTAYIARWNGSSWNAMGTGVNQSVAAIHAIGVNDDLNLYIGGTFTSASGVANTERLARWDGTNWHSVGGGVSNGGVSTILMYEGKLLVGGSFGSMNNDTVGSLYFTIYGPTVVSNIGAEGVVASAVDGADNIHLAYIDNDGALKYRYYDATSTSWANTVNLIDQTVENVSISTRPNSNHVYIAYVKTNKVYYIQGKYPYDAADWSTPIEISSSGTVSNVNLATGNSSGRLSALWTNAASAPIYTINTAIVDTTINYTWDGDGDGTSWNDSANWDQNYSYPQSGDDLVTLGADLTIPTGTIGALTLSSGTSILSGALTITQGQGGNANLVINAGAQLSTGGNNLSVGGVFNNQGSFSLLGSESVSLSSIGSAGTISYTANSGTVSLQNWPYQTLNINGSASFLLANNTAFGALNVLQGSLLTKGYDLSGTQLSIASGATLDATTGAGGTTAIVLSANLANAGNFLPANSTFSFAPTTQSIVTGSSNFYNLSINAPAKTVLFAAGSTQTVNNTLTLKGASGGHLNLDRYGGSGSDQWLIHPKGIVDVDYVSVKNSSNLALNAINPPNSADQGNNTNWFTTVATITPSPSPSPTPTPTPTPIPTPTPTSEVAVDSSAEEQADEVSEVQTTPIAQVPSYTPPPDQAPPTSGILQTVIQSVTESIKAVQEVVKKANQALIATTKVVRESEVAQTVSSVVAEPAAVGFTILISTQAAVSGVSTSSVAFTPTIQFIPYNLIFALLYLFGLRPRRHSCKVVDSTNAKGIAYATVRIFKGEQLVASEVSDGHGRFLLNLVVGNYRLAVSKEGYRYPAAHQLKSLPSDNLWATNLIYYGERIAINDPSNPPTLLIPLDRIEQDRGLVSMLKKRLVAALYLFDKLMAALGGPLLLFLFALALFLYIMHPESVLTLIGLVFYGVLLILNWLNRLALPKTYALVLDAKTKKPLPNINVVVIDLDYHLTRSSLFTDSRGRFRVLLAKGRYQILINDQRYALDEKNSKQEFTIARDSLFNAQIYAKRSSHSE